MWGIRFLSGPLAGQTIPLQNGRNVIGRGPNCEIKIPSQSVSKEHAQIEVNGDKITITDLNSRNGTFVKGVQIRKQQINLAEPIGVFDILFEVIPLSAHKSHQANPNSDSTGEIAAPAADMMTKPNFLTYILKYIDEVVLPGVYKLGEWMEYRTLLALFVGSFILLVTALSTIPLMRILKSSIEKEAQNRAQTIARILVRDNRNPIMQGQTSLVSVDSTRNEPGVSRTFIISANNGEILAPPQLAGQYVTDVPYVNEARKRSEESVSQINSSTIVALAPIKYYNPATGAETVAAHAVVIYDMGALAVDDGKTISLFVQILFIACILGGILYFFLYKVVTHPLIELNTKMDQALRDGHTQVSTAFLYPELQHLASNINSAVNRGGGGFAGEQMQGFELDRSIEIQNIIQLVGFAALAAHPTDRTIITANEHFLNQIGTGSNWQNLPMDKIFDQALKLNLQSLVDRAVQDPTQLVSDQLEIANQNYDISAQGVYGSKSLAYIIVVFVPKAGGN